MSSDTRTRLQAVFRDVFDDDKLEVTDDLERESVEAWDSLGHIRLVSEIEETFGVSLSIEQIEGLTSVRQILAILDAGA